MSKALEDFLTAEGVIPEAEAPARLTVRTPAELLAMSFDDTDNLLGDRILSEGNACACFGVGGLGKSFLSLQLAVCSIIGWPWCGIETHAQGKRWLFIQSENNNRRLHFDLKRLREFVGEAWPEVEKALFIHTIETDTDAFLALASDPEIFNRCAALMEQIKPDILVFDPLRDATFGDLSKDADMATCCQALSALFRRGNPKRACLLLHHALTGATGALRATGFDRSSFGRNSKVLYGWARACINLAPVSPDDNSKLLLSCGKNNNGREFEPIGLNRDPETLIFNEDPSFDLNAWKNEVSDNPSKKRFEPTIEKLLAHLPPGKPVDKTTLLSKLALAGWPKHTARDFLQTTVAESKVFEFREKRPGLRDAVFVTRTEPNMMTNAA